MSECCVCYSKLKNNLKCKNGRHPTCTGCLEKGNMLTVSSSGWPVLKYKCPVCRDLVYEWTHEINDLKLARAVIAAFQKSMRVDSDDE